MRARAPRAGEKVAPAGVTVADVAARYLESPQFLRLAPTTRKTYRAALDKEILPRFGRAKIGQVDAEQLARFIFDTETREKRNRSKGGRAARRSRI